MKGKSSTESQKKNIFDCTALLISQVTESIQDEVIAWQNRPLDEVYPILFRDGLVVSTRCESKIIKHTIYLALAIKLPAKLL